MDDFRGLPTDNGAERGHVLPAAWQDVVDREVV
jgi:hypothetical protein